MDAKTFVSFKTCKFNNFLKFLQDYLNLADCTLEDKRRGGEKEFVLNLGTVVLRVKENLE
jgi:hypothetical protein